MALTLLLYSTSTTHSKYDDVMINDNQTSAERERERERVPYILIFTIKVISEVMHVICYIYFCIKPNQ